jgi:hypothetical protein
MASVRVTSTLAWLHYKKAFFAGDPHTSVHSHFTTQQGPSVVVRSWLHSPHPISLCFCLFPCVKLPTIKWPGCHYKSGNYWIVVEVVAVECYYLWWGPLLLPPSEEHSRSRSMWVHTQSWRLLKHPTNLLSLNLQSADRSYMMILFEQEREPQLWSTMTLSQ